MKILIAGLGSVGVRHLNNLCTLGVKEISVFRVRNLPPPTMLHGENFKIFQDYDKALASGPDAVVIANPTAYHAEYAKKALLAGCHVYLEKPVSHSLEETDILLDLSRKHQSIIMVGCQLRFHPNLIAIKKWVQGGVVGRIFSVQVDTGEYLPDWHPWEDYSQSYAARKDLGGGVILTVIHEFDYLFWIFGAVKNIYAIGGHLTPLKTDVEDTALISLWTEQGLPIQLRIDYWRKPSVRKMHIVGETGEILWDYYKGEAVLMRAGDVAERNSVPEGWKRNSLFISAIRNFLEAIQNKTQVRIPLTEGVEVLKIALAAKRSMEEGRVTVG